MPGKTIKKLSSMDSPINDVKENSEEHVTNGRVLSVASKNNIDMEEGSESNGRGVGMVEVISKEMMEEEKRLEKEGKLKMFNRPKKEVSSDDQEILRRYECFKKLLEHSEAYAEFLTNKMSTQVNMRHFERKRKFALMFANKSLYADQGLDFKKYVKKEEVDTDEAAKDPSRLLEINMLNVRGDIVSMHHPFLLENTTLRQYQLDGVNWLKVLFENGVNGILADEMGLGKTIQTISVIAHLCEMGVSGLSLVVGPLSTLNNWMNEFRRFAPKIPVILYHGNMDQRMVLRNMFKPVKYLDIEIDPVVITSYEIAMRDRRFLEKKRWKYVVIDEGHRLKNYKCKLVRELKRLKTNSRLILTGTPLQNNLSELWSLLNFILPEVFDDLESFELWFSSDEMLDGESCDEILKKEQDKQILSKMHKILSPFILRRVKAEVDLGIPPKMEIIVYAPLTTLQQSYYTATLDKSISKMLGIVVENESIPEIEEVEEVSEKKKRTLSENGQKYRLRSSLDTKSRKEVTVVPTGVTHIKMLNSTMQLRRIVNHPYLLNYPIDPATELVIIDEELVNCSGKLLVLDAMLTKLKKYGHKVLIYSQMTTLLDILEDYLDLRQYSFVRLDGSMGIEERQVAINAFSEEDTFIFLLSTRAGGLGINLISADTVIIYDSDWNPQVDLQAMDRCHRIGQSKPVVIYRLVTAGTIDEHIVKKAISKKKLEMMIIQKGHFKEKKNKVGEVDIQELKELLNSSDYSVQIQANGLVFSDEKLDSFLNRSILFSESEANNNTILEKSQNKSEDKEVKLKRRGNKRKLISTSTHKVFEIIGKENNELI